MTEHEILPFELEKASTHQIIKVIGVGGGGGNAVKNMYKEGIHDVAFALCNTDAQALTDSTIPTKVAMGLLGAGNDPEKARAAAEENAEQIKELFADDTKMVFVTATMGGGTGTGASPIIARYAKEAGMLTVGVVTIPFRFERKPKIMQALHGVNAIAKNVDALLVINNERLFDIYPSLAVNEAFDKVNEILTVAVKSIAELITVRGTINLDFRDVEKVLKNGGVAVMSSGLGRGEHRVKDAIEQALHSPLLNDNDVYNSKKLLFNIYQSPDSPLFVHEMDDINSFMDEFRNNDIEVIWGIATDDTLGDQVKITILATGFGLSSIAGEEGDYKFDQPETQPQPINASGSTSGTPVHGEQNPAAASGSQAPIALDASSSHNSPAASESCPSIFGSSSSGSPVYGEQNPQATPSRKEEEAGSSRSLDDSIMARYYDDKFQCFIFSDDELGNDALIEAVAKSPTYSRTKPQLDALRP